MTRLLLLSALVSATAAAPLSAQAINGTWITEFERSLRNENGAVSAGDKAHARIVLQQKGDSVLGTWEVLNPTQSAPVPALRQLRGTIRGGKASLQTRSRRAGTSTARSPSRR